MECQRKAKHPNSLAIKSITAGLQTGLQAPFGKVHVNPRLLRKPMSQDLPLFVLVHKPKIVHAH